MGFMKDFSAGKAPPLSRFGRFRSRMASLMLFAVILAAPLIASGGADSGGYTEDSYKKAVSRQMGHRLDENEEVVAAATWLWYDQKCGHEWDKEGFSMAVEAGAKNCANEAMLAAAKTGNFGEKLLKALVVAAGDAADNFTQWVEKNSDRYGKDK